MSDATPYYRAHVFFCAHARPVDHPRGDCVRFGVDALIAHLKAGVKANNLRRVRVNAAGCLHRCRLGPVLVIYPEGVWYTFSTTDDIDEILHHHLIGGTVVDRLRLPGRPDEDHAAPHP